jgi:cobalt-zinc-cadmium efflux system protein
MAEHVHPHEESHDHPHAHGEGQAVDRGDENAHGREPAHAGHGHSHAFRDEPGRALAIALALNFAFLVAEVVIGVLSGSLAVLSDAGHMVADVAALAIALVAQRLSRVRGSSGFTFGLRRLPILGGLANALTLNAIVVLIVIASIERLTSPPEIQGAPVLIAGVLGLFVNVAGAWILWRRGGQGVNARAAFLHLAADALGSVGVIISGVVLATARWAPVDPIVSLLIALLIAAGTWPLFRDIVRTLLLGSPAQIDIEKVRAVFTNEENVRCLEDFHLWELDTDYLVLSARVHADVDSLDSADALVKRISTRLKHDFRIHHVTIEVGPHHEGHPHGENDCLGAA